MRDLCCFLGDERPFCIRIFGFDALAAEWESERGTEDEGEVGVVDLEKAISSSNERVESLDESGERRPRRAAAVDDAGPGVAAAVRRHRVAARSVNMACRPAVLFCCRPLANFKNRIKF